MRTLTLPDLFMDHDKPEQMYAQASLDSDGIVKSVLGALDAARIPVPGRAHQ